MISTLDHSDFGANELFVLRRLAHWLESALAGDRQETKPNLSQVISDCVAAKRLANCRPIYIAELKRYLSKFCDALADPPIDSVTVQDVERWLSRPDWSPGTKATGLNRLSALFSFAVRRGLIPSNPIDRIDRIKLERTPPQILSPEQARNMLVFVRNQIPSLLPHVVIGMFAGVRPAEISKLTFSDVDFDRRIIRVDAASSKVRRRRLIEVEPVAFEWLAGFRGVTGPINPKQTRRKLRRLRKLMGWHKWPKDILRHSYGSYAMAKYRDAAKVADWMGNSVGVLHRHYRELVSADDCAAFWSIMP